MSDTIASIMDDPSDDTTARIASDAVRRGILRALEAGGFRVMVDVWVNGKAITAQASVAPDRIPSTQATARVTAVFNPSDIQGMVRSMTDDLVTGMRRQILKMPAPDISPTARIDDEPMSDAQREAVTKWSRAEPMSARWRGLRADMALMDEAARFPREESDDVVRAQMARDIRRATTFEGIAETDGYYRAAADSGYTRDALLAMEVAPGQDIQPGDAVAMRADGTVERMTRRISDSLNDKIDVQTLVSYNSAAVDSVAEAYDLVRIPGESDESLRARIAFYARDQYSPSIRATTGDDLDRIANDAYGIERREPARTTYDMTGRVYSFNDATGRYESNDAPRPRSLDPDNWLLRQNAPEVMEWDRERFSMRKDAFRAEIIARNATFATMGNPLPFDAPHGGLCAFRVPLPVACADRMMRCRARKHRELTKCVPTPCLLTAF